MIKTTVLWRNFEFTGGKKRRFLEQADCLIIASDMPSAEINNAARFARLHSKQAQLKNRIKESLLKNRRILSAYNLTERDLSKHVRFLERYKPEYLYGYATILTVFAKMLDDANIKPQLSLKAVISTSETLEKWQEDLIARVFDCPVANEYGARDAGILAYTCPSGGIHITAENCIIEVLDPVTYEPVPNGQSGVLAITDLTNYVQPRLRYMLGDMGTLSTEECCCGRRLPLLTHIDGREDDLLIGPNGTLVHGNIIGQLLRPLDGLRAFQFRQHAADRATLYSLLHIQWIILCRSVRTHLGRCARTG